MATGEVTRSLADELTEVRTDDPRRVSARSSFSDRSMRDQCAYATRESHRTAAWISRRTGLVHRLVDAFHSRIEECRCTSNAHASKALSIAIRLTLDGSVGPAGTAAALRRIGQLQSIRRWSR